jgi:hypothetical protein
MPHDISSFDEDGSVPEKIGHADVVHAVEPIAATPLSPKIVFFVPRARDDAASKEAAHAIIFDGAATSDGVKEQDLFEDFLHLTTKPSELYVRAMAEVVRRYAKDGSAPLIIAVHYFNPIPEAADAPSLIIEGSTSVKAPNGSALNAHLAFKLLEKIDNAHGLVIALRNKTGATHNDGVAGGEDSDPNQYDFLSILDERHKPPSVNIFVGRDAHLAIRYALFSTIESVIKELQISQPDPRELSATLPPCHGSKGTRPQNDPYALG